MCQVFAVIAGVSEFLCVGNVDQLPRVRWILASFHLSCVDFLPMQKGNEKGCTWNVPKTCCRQDQDLGAKSTVRCSCLCCRQSAIKALWKLVIFKVPRARDKLVILMSVCVIPNILCNMFQTFEKCEESIKVSSVSAAAAYLPLFS
ncbi:hypothetical protein RHMOL_Rhmol03G0104200 [Rhododendron molle]|uniref:Uncharacterized protein n=1 Tax=Rhododendron molle TaxID=49168 RepID=A0ACC0PCQ1_RHOML|nr:hypothetical protein RHMOL_Rhmol03G0104200 [Rhododendron molle]